MLSNVSVIIPVSPVEDRQNQLLENLQELGLKSEIILEMGESRAHSLNDGGNRSSKEFLWFLHADSVVNIDCVQALDKNISEHPDALHYFNLAFAEGSVLLAINQWGAYIRSHALGIPFGDQGFCISKKLFDKLGGFPEGLKYGEDHALVSRAKQAGIKLNCTDVAIYTSARKYEDEGWLLPVFVD